MDLGHYEGARAPAWRAVLPLRRARPLQPLRRGLDAGAPGERTAAVQLFKETAARQGILPGELTAHADRGAPMRSRPLADMLGDLGIARSFSRPHVSDDNPFSESQFKTYKYQPDFPERFGSFEDAHGHSTRFFAWYNTEHRHSGLGYLTPADVHHGRAAEVLAKRQVVLQAAYTAHPSRFARGAARELALPGTVWINQPTQAVALC